MRKVVTEALTLEPQTVEHAVEMFEVLGDPAIYTYENEPPASLEWLRARFEKLESRRSKDGREQWLNWVVRLPSSELIGYVQASVRDDGSAAIAYVLSGAWWGQGLACHAVTAMMNELAGQYGVTFFTAVAKRENFRSTRLLERLGFATADERLLAKLQIEPDEVLMCRGAA